METDISNKRLKKLFEYLYSLDDFKLGRYLDEIDSIVFITLIRDCYNEIQKNETSLAIEKATINKINKISKEQESEYGFNQGEQNLYSISKENSKEKIEKNANRNQELKEKIKLFKSNLALDSFYITDIDYYKSSTLDQAAILYSIINERKDLFKTRILNLLEPIIYCRAIKEMTHEIRQIEKSKEKISRLQEINEIVDSFNKCLQNSSFMHNIIFKERPKDEFLF